MSIFYIYFMTEFLRKEIMVISIPRPIKNKKFRPKRTRTNITANILLFIEICALCQAAESAHSFLDFCRNQSALFLADRSKGHSYAFAERNYENPRLFQPG